nr:amidohydrolase family protein [Anaerocolumna cellulosilytica]
MKIERFALKGDIIYSETQEKFTCNEDSFLVCVDGRVEGIYKVLPDCFINIPVKDYTGKLIIPGLIDMHTHGPQYSFRGLGMDLELIDWLNKNTFPEEGKFSDAVYAQKAYSIFVKELVKGATTRACIYATVHMEATKLLMDLLELTGLKCMVGKVNMDRNCPDYLKEDMQESIANTREWLQETLHSYKNIVPILTPRFFPSCSESLLKELAVLQKEFNLPLQSHLSENKSEIEWVKELCPDTNNYGEAYELGGVFGKNGPVVMAHCVHSPAEEVMLMKDNGVFIAHCPESNTNLSSGIAPVRTYLDHKMKVGLGTDMAAGSSNSIFKTMVMAVQVSKLRWRLVDGNLKPLTIEEAFYLGTKGGGAFFGKVGSFEKDYEFDALVMDDDKIEHPGLLTLPQRLERVIYLSEGRHIAAKFVAGKNIFAFD